MYFFLGCKGIKFIYYNLFSVILFAILYFVQNINQKESETDISVFLYYLWFSLITQTTIGYGGLKEDGKSVPWIETTYLFKTFNILQLLSIFLISSSFL